MKKNDRQFSYSLKINPSKINPIKVDVDFGKSNLYLHISEMISQKKFKQAHNYLTKALYSGTFKKSEVYYMLTRVWAAQSKLQEAIAFAVTGIKEDPNDANLHIAAGEIYALSGDYKTAIDYLMEAHRLRPKDSEILRLIGESCLQANHISAAMKYFVESLKINKYNYFTWQNMASALHARGNVSEALEAASQYLHEHLNNRQVLTKFEADAHCNYLFMRMAIEYDFKKLMADFKAFADIYASDISYPVAIRKREPGRKIRVGYVGSDFYRHAALSIYRPLFDLYDPEIFEIYAYSSTVHEDAVTDELMPLFTRWLNVTSFSDQDLFNRIRNDEIDILVDLNGITTNNRLFVFTRRSAPIQITGLGFISPTNIPQVDMYFSDPYITNRERADAVENQSPWILPSVMHYSPPKEEIEIRDFPFKESGYITFGSANNLYKITPQVIGVWANILKKVPNSKIALKSKQFDDELTAADVLKRFHSFGINADRIELVGLSSYHEHIKFWNNVDIALDSFPYQGGITTCEAQYMGVPFVTIDVGTKTSVSLSRNIGKDYNPVADGISEYIECATKVASQIKNGSIPTKQQIRDSFLESAVCDSKSYCQNIENAYIAMFNAYQDAIEELEKESIDP